MRVLSAPESISPDVVSVITIDYEIVWQAIQESLPVLRAEVEQVLREMGEESG